ncbi:hypothetical protein EV421DRAFT_1913025 [Armillaria borealis]|uniref:Uncharacterized protein n=1 Tax=Armillaria borealis TaxID=47425 RepID=A0AA39IV77_9AGAR|nr:hypothetical protein EV421DRAFT_1913025 [Armillaria borealis]
MSTKTPSDVISQASHKDGQTNISMAMTFNSLVPGEYAFTFKFILESEAVKTPSPVADTTIVPPPIPNTLKSTYEGLQPRDTQETLNDYAGGLMLDEDSEEIIPDLQGEEDYILPYPGSPINLGKCRINSNPAHSTSSDRLKQVKRHD